MKTTKDLAAARADLEENGGWLLDLDGVYGVTEDKHIALDLRGQHWLDRCEREQCWDETLLGPEDAL